MGWRSGEEIGEQEGAAIAAGIIALGEWARRCGSQLCRECNGSMRGGACHPDGTRTCISCMNLRERHELLAMARSARRVERPEPLEVE